MTHIEAKEKLKNRVEWEKPLDPEFSFLVFSEPESGRYLQEEHAAVRIGIIYETLFYIDITNDEFQKKLEYIKEKAVLQMLHDVFYDQKEICDQWILDETNLFDYAIILKNSCNVIFDVLNSTRKNLTDKVTEENATNWFIDLNGLKNGDNGVYVQGFVSRYRREIERIRKVLFIRNRTLKVVTAR